MRLRSHPRLSDEAKIADPAYGFRTFRWMLEKSSDERGNVVEYLFKKENLDGVPRVVAERHHHSGAAPVSANTYLKRIRYGNKTTSPTADADFAYHIIFDYGEHDAAAPAIDDSGTWLARQDAFSSYRAGFEIRTYRLCRRILVFHDFAELTSLPDPLPNPLLVRSTDFTYEEGPSLTYLRQATQKGYLWNDTTEVYDATALPPADFDYSRATFQSKVVDLDATSLRGIPGAIAGRNYQWVDLDGEGVPGVLCRHAGAMLYKKNLGQGKLAPPRTLQSQPSAAVVARSGQQLLDITGDGLPDFVDYGGPSSGFYPRTDDGGWGRFRRFGQLPNVNWDDPSLRFIDLDGDGFADIMMSEHHVYVWYPSLEDNGFGAGRRASRYNDEDKGPTVVFAEAEQTVFLADMSGDGVQDLVRIRNGSVVYWPNTGYGTFGPKVTMGEAPHMAPTNLYSPSRVRLADLDGSGTADLIYIGADGVKVWRNQAGNSFGSAEKLAIFPDHSALSTIDLVDLLGTGTACLVWSTSLQGKAPQVRYVDLLGSVKPHLLVSSANNLGLETKIRYAPSTKFYLEDKAAGIDWATRLPFPVHIVDRVEHYDHVTKHRFVSTYKFRHGFYDPEEREFRGFGYVEQRDTEVVSGDIGKGLFPDDLVTENNELPQPPVVTKSWFHTGAWQKRKKIFDTFEAEWFDDGGTEPRLTIPAMPAGLSPVELHQAHRALAGALLRTEVYSESLDEPGKLERLYTVSQQSYAVRREQPTESSPYAVFFRSGAETLSIHYDYELVTTPAHEPRLTHELVLEVDDFGNVTKSASIAYGHPSLTAESEQKKSWMTGSEQSVVAPLAPSTGDYRHSVPYEQRQWEFGASVEPMGTLWTATEALAGLGLTASDFDAYPTASTTKRLLAHTRTLYLDASGAVAPLGQAGSPLRVHQSYVMALTGPMVTSTLGLTQGDVIDADVGYRTFDESAGTENTGDVSSTAPYWAASGTQSYADATRFYLVTSVTDMFGNTSSVSYDGHDLFATQVTDPIGNAISATIDYRVGAPSTITDINGNFAHAAFDALGRVTKTWLVGKGTAEGDSESEPTAKFTYDLDRYDPGDPTAEPPDPVIPARIKSERRETHGDPQTRWLVAYSYLNGAGGEMMAKVQAEPHPDTPAVPRWVGTGRTVVDNKGNPIKQYEPYFSATEEFEDDPDVVETGVTPVLHYDPVGRLIRTEYPDGSTSRVEFDPWMQKSFDRHDTTGEPDNLWYAAKSADSDSFWQQAAAKAVEHSYNDEVEALPPPPSPPDLVRVPPGSEAPWGTPTVTYADALGRAFLVVEHNRVEGAITPTNPVGASLVDELAETTTKLDIQGNVLEVEDALDRVCMSYTYGMLGQVLKLDSIDAGARFMFDATNGQPVRMWGERGAPGGSTPYTQSVTYDDLRRPTEIWVDDGGTSKKIQTMTYGEGHDDVIAKNLRGRLVEHRDQSGIVTTADYDFKGNLKTQIRQLVEEYQNIVDWSGSPTLETATYAQTFEYDALNRPTSVTLPDSTEIQSSFNVASLLASVIAYVRGAGAATTFVDTIDYDEKGRRTKIAYVDSTGDRFYTDYTYDELTFRLETLVTSRIQGSTTKKLQDLTYYYDAVGNITHVTDAPDHDVYFSAASVPSGAGDFTYDALYRLIEADGREHATGTPVQLDEDGAPVHNIPHPNDPSGLRTYTRTYIYDVVGNLLSLKHDAGTPGSWTRTYSYTSGTNQLASTSHGSLGTRTYSHDAHGNMAAMPHLSVIAWDYADQLKHAKVNSTDDTYFTYDASGQRVRKVYIHGQYEDHTIYLGGYEILRRYDNGTKTLERETVHVSDDARRICMVETTTVGGSGTRYRFQLDDHLGTVAVEVTETGAIISYEQYHPYGTSAYRAWDSGLGVSAKRYRYNGKERDEATGLYYYGARYYAPWLGRWTAADPLAFADGVGSYTYVRGSPIVLSDPNGKMSAAEKIVYEAAKFTAQELAAIIGSGGPAANQVGAAAAETSVAAGATVATGPLIVGVGAFAIILTYTPGQPENAFDEDAYVAQQKAAGAPGFGRPPVDTSRPLDEMRMRQPTANADEPKPPTAPRPKGAPGEPISVGKVTVTEGGVGYLTDTLQTSGSGGGTRPPRTPLKIRV